MTNPVFDITVPSSLFSAYRSKADIPAEAYEPILGKVPTHISTLDDGRLELTIDLAHGRCRVRLGFDDDLDEAKWETEYRDTLLNIARETGLIGPDGQLRSINS